VSGLVKRLRYRLAIWLLGYEPQPPVMRWYGSSPAESYTIALTMPNADHNTINWSDA
jgi:hypothetical protein